MIPNFNYSDAVVKLPLDEFMSLQQLILKQEEKNEPLEKIEELKKEIIYLEKQNAKASFNYDTNILKTKLENAQSEVYNLKNKIEKLEDKISYLEGEKSYAEEQKEHAKKDCHRLFTRGFFSRLFNIDNTWYNSLGY
jgi:hypothetical protein